MHHRRFRFPFEPGDQPHRLFRKRRFLIGRFALFFAPLVVSSIIVLSALAYLLVRVFNNNPQIAAFVGMGSCVLALLIPSGIFFIARRVFRSIGTPLAHIMDAADAVAEGDLSVQVPEHYRGEFGQLARSFNRMTRELAHADQQRRHLTADVAHELRTPLHIIQGNLEGIQDGVYQPTPEHIGATLDEIHLLARLVEDLQTLSLAETGQLDLKHTPVDVAELLADVHTSFSGQAEAAGVTLEVAVSPTKLTVIGDADRLDQVLSNLVANALRYTPPGGHIWLRAEPFQSEENQLAGVRLQVQDSGAGIPPEDLPFVFDRFWRGDRSRTRQEGAGSGLGLAISRQLVKAHGGAIRVESQVGQGTTFTFELPGEVDEPSRPTIE